MNKKVNFNSLFFHVKFYSVIHKAKLQKIYGKYEEKKVGVAGLQPTLISLDCGKLLN